LVGAVAAVVCAEIAAGAMTRKATKIHAAKEERVFLHASHYTFFVSRCSSVAKEFAVRDWADA